MKSIDDDIAWWLAQSNGARSKQAALVAFGAYAALRLAKEDYVGKVYSSEGCADAMVADGLRAEAENYIDNGFIAQQRDRIYELESAARFLLCCMMNDMTVQGQTKEWSPDSGIGRMFKALGCDSTQMDAAAHAVISGPYEQTATTEEK